MHKSGFHAILATVLSLVVGGVAACAPEPPAPLAVTKVRTDAEDLAHPGREVYVQNCSGCHDHPDQSNAPALASIREFDRSRLKYALEYGVMLFQAQNVPPDDLVKLIDWLPIGDSANTGWIDAAACSIKQRGVQLENAKRTVTALGIDYKAHRSQTAAEAGLVKADMKNLQVAWTIAFPQNPNMRSQPVIVGDTIFISATDIARLFALDTKTGCVKWTYVSDFPMRSSLAFAEAVGNSPPAIVLSDAAGFVHAVDGAYGKRLWVSDVKLSRFNRLTGAPVVMGNRVFVPVSINEATFANTDTYECCVTQGAVVTLDLETGKKIWVGRAIDQDPAPTIKNRIGAQLHGPSGAPIWSTPVLDLKRNQLYAGTGQNMSWPTTETSDAVIAFDLDTGAKRWVFQASKDDIFTFACMYKNANCEFPGKFQASDYDFGAASMLVNRKDGSEVVIAGQKSGTLWALNPDNGKPIWSNRIGRGSAGGGIHFGMAFDGERIFAPIADPDVPYKNPNWGPGIHAVNAMTGEIEWTYQPNARDCGRDVPIARATKPAPEWRIIPVEAPEVTPPVDDADKLGSDIDLTCRLSMSAMPLLVDDALVTGTVDGMLRIFDNVSGEVLFEYMTARDFPDTVNKIPGKGGQLNNAPYVAADGTLFVQSGYGRGAGPGNVLIAFRPRKN